MAVKISSYRNRVKTGLPSNAEELAQGCRITAVLGTFDSNQVTAELCRGVARIFQRGGHRGYSPDCHVDLHAHIN